MGDYLSFSLYTIGIYTVRPSNTLSDIFLGVAQIVKLFPRTFQVLSHSSKSLNMLSVSFQKVFLLHRV